MTESLTPRRAWQIDRELRLAAVPLDRRIHPSDWYTSETVFPTGDELIKLFWNATVPGSGAPEIPYVEMVESLGTRATTCARAEALLPEGIRLAGEKRMDDLRALTAELLALLHERAAHPEPSVLALRLSRPDVALRARVAAGCGPGPGSARAGDAGSKDAGGLALPIGGRRVWHGHRGLSHRPHRRSLRRDRRVHHDAGDDERRRGLRAGLARRLRAHGRRFTARQLGLEWVRQIPFGWSAEWIALRNLNMGMLPPGSGSFRNPYCDWIGAQMRGMVCGMLAPGWPLEAARLAYMSTARSRTRATASTAGCTRRC